MNKKDLIISYFLAIPCIYALTMLDYPSDWNLPLLICAMLLYPLTFLLLQKRTKYKKFRQNNEKYFNKIIKKYPTTFMYLYFFLFIAISSLFYNIDKGFYVVAIVNTPEKANEIQTLLTKKHRSTGRRIINYNDETKYLITLSRYETNEKQWKEAISELNNSSVIDDSIEIPAKNIAQ